MDDVISWSSEVLLPTLCFAYNNMHLCSSLNTETCALFLPLMGLFLVHMLFSWPSLPLLLLGFYSCHLGSFKTWRPLLSSVIDGLPSFPLDSRLLKDQRPCSLSHPMFPYAPNSVAEHMNNGTLPRYERTDLSISVNT